MATDIDITPYIEKFEDFYTSALSEKINRLLSEYPLQKSLLVDYEELERFDRELADLLVTQPDSLIAAAESALVQTNEVLFKTAHPDEKFEPHVRFFNLPDSGLLIQDISSRNIRELISVKGVWNRVTSSRGPDGIRLSVQFTWSSSSGGSRRKDGFGEPRSSPASTAVADAVCAR